MTDLKARIEEANQNALNILMTGRPVLTGVRPSRNNNALEVVPGMTKNMVLHSAPPIEWERMCGPHRNGIIGAVLWEGLAATNEEASRLIEQGEIIIEPCHHHDHCRGRGRDYICFNADVGG